VSASAASGRGLQVQLSLVIDLSALLVRMCEQDRDTRLSRGYSIALRPETEADYVRSVNAVTPDQDAARVTADHKPRCFRPVARFDGPPVGSEVERSRPVGEKGVGLADPYPRQGAGRASSIRRQVRRSQRSVPQLIKGRWATDRSPI
jgi:hypothetical protein